MPAISWGKEILLAPRMLLCKCYNTRLTTTTRMDSGSDNHEWPLIISSQKCFPWPCIIRIGGIQWRRASNLDFRFRFGPLLNPSKFRPTSERLNWIPISYLPGRLAYTFSKPPPVAHCFQGLSQFYERTKDWEKYSDVLRRLVDMHAKSWVSYHLAVIYHSYIMRQ